jgi:hypothetical protein
MPRETASAAEWVEPSGWPSKLIFPDHGACRPKIVCSAVVFPAPLWPIRAIASPEHTFRVTSSRIHLLPYPAEIFVKESKGSAERLKRAKVDLREAGIVRQIRDLALRGDVPKLHKEHHVREFLDDMKAVLDNADGLPVSPHESNELKDIVDAARIDSRGRLIQEQHIGVGAKKASERNELLLSKRERPGGSAGGIGKADRSKPMMCAFANLPLHPIHDFREKHQIDEILTALSARRPSPKLFARFAAVEHHILQRRHAGKESEILERSGHSKASDAIGRQIFYLLSI